jgi:hypothetical protein
MNRVYEFRLIQASRPADSRTKPAKVIELESRRAQRVERIRQLQCKRVGPDAA